MENIKLQIYFLGWALVNLLFLLLIEKEGLEGLFLKIMLFIGFILSFVLSVYFTFKEEEKK